MKPFDLLGLVTQYLDGISQPEQLLAGEDLTSSSLQALALEVAIAAQQNPDLRLALCFPTLFDMQQFSDLLNDFLPEGRTMLFPKDEIIRSSGSTASTEMERERLNTLSLLLQKRNGIVLFNAAALLERLVTPETFEAATLTVKRGETLDRQALLDKLSSLGYVRTDWVNGPFEYAARGAVVDIFSPASPLPFRIELDDDLVEELATFSPDSRVNEQSLESIVILPCTERPIGMEVAKSGVATINKILAHMTQMGAHTIEFENLKSHASVMVGEILATGNIRDGYERYFPYFDISKASIADYLSGFTTYCVQPEEVTKRAQESIADEKQYLALLRERSGELAAASAYEPANLKYISNSKRIEINIFDSNDGIGNIKATNKSLAESGQLFNAVLADGGACFACVDPKVTATLTEYLNRTEIPYTLDATGAGVRIIPYGLSSGFSIGKRATFISSREIFGSALKRSRFLTRYREFHAVRKYTDLKEGDYIVHEDHGIGRYRGLTQQDGIDFLEIEYAKGTTLFVPVYQFSKIRKYAGSEAAHPALDIIGGSTWARRKEKIRNRLTFLTDRLLNIYAERASSLGISFQPDSQLEGEFASRFQFPLTASQIKAWDSISKDMESAHPMDRLIAGDVGFGKTELAFKACFRAIINGYQAAILCPTTVLARQHYEVALQRFADFGVRIALLSRFEKGKDNERALKDLAEGKIDLIIGTHRLLSQDVKFKKLGFLAVDEEQRFGVAQKERIKEITKAVDVLSLSATPIPRTLQMSLMSIKPMSILTEAPSNRLPVKTYVVHQDDGLVKEVIQRELGRGGQVYFLHNRIDSIYARAGDIRKMFPAARIEVAHGKMDARALADVMNDFYDGNIDILVCTSIIESGLDVPNVNTVIIEDAQNFGLSALYQIKGRVGRSDRLAYAYLFYRDYSHLTEEGKERLKAIRDFTALGSGYRIAQRDLAIRGAGNILGSEQAGFVDSLGLDAYNQLLDEVMRQRLAQEQGIKAAARPQTRFLLSFTIDARIPDSYASESDRITLYREFADCVTLKELEDLIKRVRDSYGPYPLEVENLICKRRIEILLEDTKVFDSFQELMETFRITMDSSYSDVKDIAKTTEQILSPLEDHVQSVRFSARKFIITLRRTSSYMADLVYLVTQLTQARYGRAIEPYDLER